MDTKARTPAGPKLSIAVPAYNAGRFIDACLASITGQMGPGHELLVVDDGSRDATRALAERVRAQHPRLAIRVIHQHNVGVAAARNRLLAEARGEYLMFVDADDVVLPGALAALGAAIGLHNPDVIACDFRFSRPGNERKSRSVALGYPADTLCSDRESMLRILFADRHMYLWANVVRREIYARLPRPVFPPGRVFEDISVLPRLLAECRSLYRLARPVIDYRQHPASLTKAVSPTWCADFAAALWQVKRSLGPHIASDSVRMHADVAMSHYYIGIVKNSYQLPWRAGRDVRAQVSSLFLDSLFHPVHEVLSAMERGAVLTHTPRRDAVVARQVRMALDDSMLFAIAKAASRRLKLWQRLAA